MKIALESFRNRADHMEDRITEFENRKLQVIQREEERELRSKKKKLWNSMTAFRKCNITIMGIPNEKREEDK